MSEKESQSLAMARLERERAMAEVLKSFVPQLFSNPKILGDNAPDSGDQDAWMLTNMPADVLIPLTALQLIGTVDRRPEICEFVQLILRGLKGVSGFTVKQGERIAIGLGGTQNRRLAKRPGIIGRNITDRDWKNKAEEEGAEIV